ncbi:MAG TPA: low affinity iron permease family protein [Kofleriaceae bacterium]|nr:low affinity iron permease family protein [Kofleriaceae bacterium]
MIGERFRRASTRVATAIGTPFAFIIAFLFVLAWAVTGPLFGFSDTWQLIINTSTTVVTFLMVFIIQTTQNHDAKAIHLKLDELIRAVREARTGLVDLEDLPDDQIDQLQKEFRQLRLQEHTR